MLLTILLKLYLLATSIGIANGPDHEVQRYKSRDGGSYITIGSYHFEEKQERAPAFYYINNVVIDPADKLKDTTITVQPGDFRISGKYISKLETIVEKLTISKGDSVAVKLYLKNDPEPLR